MSADLFCLMLTSLAVEPTNSVKYNPSFDAHPVTKLSTFVKPKELIQSSQGPR